MNNLTEFTIKIITAQDPKIAEQDLRNAIRKVAYDISDFTVEEVD